MKWYVPKSCSVLNNKWVTIRKDNVRLLSSYEMEDYYVGEQPTFVNIIAVDKKDLFF